MPQLYANNAYGLLASSAGAIATTLTLTSGNGARFPNPTGGDFFLLTLIGLDGNGNEASWEIVKCTARSTDTLTVVRAQESTTAGIWAGGTRVELRATAGGFGTYLVASNLSTYAPLASPALTGTPAAPTAAVDTNTTQIATTAYVVGQAYLKSATASSTYQTQAGMSSYLTTASASSTYAPLASPTLTGTPAAPTAAVDTNTTQLATTAYVVGQGYLKSATASSTYAPLVSPTLTGTPAAPTAAVDTNTTQLATTAYVVGQGYLKSATASSTYQTQAGMSSYLTTASASTTYLPLAGGSIAGNLTFSGTGRRIIADFDNATLASRAAFQTSTTNGTTAVQAIANGTGAASYYVAFAGSDPANAAYGWISATTSGIDIYSDKTGTGSVQPIRLLTGGTVRASVGALGGVDLATGLREAKVTMGANDVDLRAGNYFTKTISGVTTLTVSNVPATGIAASFILDLTNGGSATITWWSGTKWAGGTAPTLTAAGRDVLGFFTHDGGTTWSGLVLGKDVK